MRKSNIMRSVVLALLLLSFTVGVVHLFFLRFETGDIYPAYSSLRSDPLGTKALYESLENFDDIAIHRNYNFLQSLKIESGTTFFYLGISPEDYHSVPKELINLCDRLTQFGGRLVLSFLPVHKMTENKKNKPSEKEPESQKVEDLITPQETGKNNPVSIKKHWGINFAFNENLPIKDGKYLALNATSSTPALPPIISWHTNLYFDLLDNTWQILYSCEGKPVIVERPFNKGSIVLCADSFFISNEALQLERHPKILARLLGRNSRIIFDEAHFGIYKQPGVAALLRHYRFHWFFGALAVMALLFVWKSGVYFLPPRKNDVLSSSEVASEKDYARGLIALLRRNIPENEILQVCGREWEQTFKKDKRVQAATFERVKSLLQTSAESSKKRTDPLNGYRKISRIISED